MTDELPRDWIAQGKRASMESGLTEELVRCVQRCFEGRNASMSERAGALADVTAACLAVWPESVGQSFERISGDYAAHLAAVTMDFRKQHDRQAAALERRSEIKKV